MAGLVHSWLVNRRLLWGLVALGAIAVSLQSAGLFEQTVFNPGGVNQLGQFLIASVHPDLSREFLTVAVRAAWVTLAYGVCGTVLSVGAGFIGGILASKVWWAAVFPRTQGRWLWLTIRAMLAIPRAIHELIWGLFFINIFGLDPLAAILAIAIPYGAIVTKVFSEILDETPRQPLLVLLNSGVAPLTAFSYSLIPQAWLNLVSYASYRFECSLRSAAVLGIIGAGGLGYEILLSLQSLRYEQLWTLFYALFFLNGLVDLSSAGLRRRLGSPSRLDLNLSKGLATGRVAKTDFKPRRSLRFNPVLWLVGFIGVLLVPVCFRLTGADFSKLWSGQTLTLLTNITGATWPPNFAPEQLPQLFSLSLQTLAMSILAIAVAGLGGIILSFPAASNFFLAGGLLSSGGQGFGDRVLAWGLLLVTRGILLMARSIPAPIWAFGSVCLSGSLDCYRGCESPWGFRQFRLFLVGVMAEGIENL
ncbi:MAG: ABC transporter permease subunit, partial [Chloroflexaceae bacterium]|nr:ABC transporter permease subunit [Chloroflexaceae bacterium]